MKPWQVGASFIISSISSCFVNKYVLTILNFRFPTIFQGWQCLISLLALMYILRSQGVKAKIKRCVDFHYLPEVIFFICSIYAGSKALASLPVPIFLGLQNLSSFLAMLLKITMLDERPNNQTVFSQMVLLTACFFLWNNEQGTIKATSYFWIFVHVVSAAFCAVFEHVNPNEAVDHDGILLINHLIGFMVLTPGTYILGDIEAAKSYPNLYYSKFYVGVLLSGIFSAFTSALYSQLLSPEKKSISIHSTQINSISGYIALSRILSSILSLFIFEFISLASVCWCITACLVVPAIQAAESNNSCDLAIGDIEKTNSGREHSV